MTSTRNISLMSHERKLGKGTNGLLNQFIGTAHFVNSLEQACRHEGSSH